MGNMKKANSNSNHSVVKLEDQLRAATTKALTAEKAARAQKEKARAAKRSFKAARSAFKLAKKAARKAAKRARQAHEELEVCVSGVAKAKKRMVLQNKRDGAKPTTTRTRPVTHAPRRKTTLGKADEPLPVITSGMGEGEKRETPEPGVSVPAPSGDSSSS
jgi:hypothetical protein